MSANHSLFQFQLWFVWDQTNVSKAQTLARLKFPCFVILALCVCCPVIASALIHKTVQIKVHIIVFVRRDNLGFWCVGPSEF